MRAHHPVKGIPRGRTGSERLDAQMIVSELLTQPPKRTFHLSEFGEKFLRFIAAANGPKTTQDATPPF